MDQDQDDRLANALRRQDERRAAVLADETEVPYCPPCGLCVNCDRQTVTDTDVTPSYQPKHAKPTELQPVEVCPFCEETPGFGDVESAAECPLCYGKGWLPVTP